MFQDCKSLEELDISSFSTDKVVDMSSMFIRCINLKKLDISNFDIRNVRSMGNIFDDCRNLESIKLPREDNSRDIVMFYLKYLGNKYKLYEEVTVCGDKYAYRL